MGVKTPEGMLLEGQETESPASSSQANLDMVLDLELPLTVRLGASRLELGEALELSNGTVIELDRPADAPVELCVNGRRVALGELVIVDGNFAVRVTEIGSRADLIRTFSP